MLAVSISPLVSSDRLAVLTWFNVKDHLQRFLPERNLTLQAWERPQGDEVSLRNE